MIDRNSMDNTRKEFPRFSNIEASRILAMFLIVAHHLAVHGGVPIWQGDFPMSENFYIAQMFSTGGKIGVNLFIFITGYFLFNKISKLSSLVYLWLSTFCYVLLFYLIFSAAGIQPFSWSSFLACFFPIRNNFYWFVSAYFVLILASPFLTLSIQALGEKKLLALLIIFGIIWSVIPTMTTTPEYYSSTLLWFFYLYFVGAYLRIKLEHNRLKNYKVLLLAFVPWLCIAGLVLISDINNRSETGVGYIDWFTFANMTSIFSLISAIGLFVLFKQWQIGHHPWINKVAAAMLGVYLIHENPLVYPWLWGSIFNVKKHLEEPYFLLYATGVTVLIFVVCTLLEMLREHYMRKWFKKRLLPVLKPFDLKVQVFFETKNQ